MRGRGRAMLSPLLLLLLCVSSCAGAVLLSDSERHREDDDSVMYVNVADVMAQLRAASRLLDQAASPPGAAAPREAREDRPGRLRARNRPEALRKSIVTLNETKSRDIANANHTELKQNATSKLHEQQAALQNLFAHLKSNIAHLNKREVDGRQENQKVLDRLRQRLESDRARLNSTDLSPFNRELIMNRTQTEERELKYWTTGRSLQHNMFHANLKVTHGLMSRVKTVMQAYEEMLAKGRLDPPLAQALHHAQASLPKVFLELQTQVRHAVRNYGVHLQRGRRLETLA